MNDTQFDIIGHSLGINISNAKRSSKKKDKKLPKEYYRNYFQAGKGHSSWDDLLEMEELGLMTKREQFGMPVFHVTEEGKDLFSKMFISTISK